MNVQNLQNRVAENRVVVFQMKASNNYFAYSALYMYYMLVLSLYIYYILFVW